MSVNLMSLCQITECCSHTAHAQEPAATSLGEGSLAQLHQRLDALEAEVTGQLEAQGFGQGQIECERYLNLRYNGTDVPIMTLTPEDGNFAAAFEAGYKVGVGGVRGDKVSE